MESKEDVDADLGYDEEQEQALVPAEKDGSDDGELDVYEGKSLDPIEKLTRAALRMCDLTYDRAFAIDKQNLGKKLGEYTMARLMEIFFDRIYKDKNEWFTALFAHTTKEDMAQYLADYLLQRLGGDPYYSANKGIPALILSHMYVEVTARTAERWLEHFEEALDDVQDDVTPQEKEVIFDHMRYAAYFLVAAQLQQQEDAAAGIHFLD